MGIRSFFKSKTVDPLERAPYLFPWYVHDDTPRILRNDAAMRWHYRERVGEEYVGVVTLCLWEKIYGLFRIYDYVLPSPDERAFCVWRQQRVHNRPVNQLNIDFFRSSEVLELKEVEKEILSMNTEDMPYLLA